MSEPMKSSTATELAQVTHERNVLADAIREAVVKAGICRSDASLTGPHLLLLLKDLTEQAMRVPKVVVRLRLDEGVFSEMLVDQPVSVVTIEHVQDSDSDDVIQIPEKDGSEISAVATVLQPTVDPVRVAEMFEAVEQRKFSAGQRP